MHKSQISTVAFILVGNVKIYLLKPQQPY